MPRRDYLGEAHGQRQIFAAGIKEGQRLGRERADAAHHISCADAYIMGEKEFVKDDGRGGYRRWGNALFVALGFDLYSSLRNHIGTVEFEELEARLDVVIDFVVQAALAVERGEIKPTRGQRHAGETAETFPVPTAEVLARLGFEAQPAVGDVDG